MPNVMAALPNIAGALCSTPQIWLARGARCYRMPWSNEAKTPNPLKFAWMLQTTEPISGASGPRTCGGDFAV